MKLNKKFNKIVSWVLCLAMVFNLMPVFPALGAAPAGSDYQNHTGFIFGYIAIILTNMLHHIVGVFNMMTDWI